MAITVGVNRNEKSHFSQRGNSLENACILASLDLLLTAPTASKAPTASASAHGSIPRNSAIFLEQMQ